MIIGSATTCRWIRMYQPRWGARARRCFASRRFFTRAGRDRRKEGPSVTSWAHKKKTVSCWPYVSATGANSPRWRVRRPSLLLVCVRPIRTCAPASCWGGPLGDGRNGTAEDRPEACNGAMQSHRIAPSREFTVKRDLSGQWTNQFLLLSRSVVMFLHVLA